MSDIDTLLYSERVELRNLRQRWREAKDADKPRLEAKLRAELLAWGCFPPNFETYRPQFEVEGHKQARREHRRSK